MRSLIIGVIVVAVLALGTFVLIQGNNNKETENPSSSVQGTTNNVSEESSEDENTSEALDETTITYTDNGFEPSSSAVKAGGKIVWVNNSSGQLQIGTDPHPSHTGNKEITGNQFVLTIEPGASETVTVEEKGTFGFHNHLISSDTGSVTVK